MIKIKIANNENIEVLALLGRITYAESHGHFIDDKNDLIEYINNAFSISKTKEDVNNLKNIFYIIYVNELPVGYAKLILNEGYKNITSQNNCLLERIYILDDFIPMKIGKKFFAFLEDKARELNFDNMWLSVYIKNNRAIRFYQKNKFKEIGELNFLVNGKEYENIVFSKKL